MYATHECTKESTTKCTRKGRAKNKINPFYKICTKKYGTDLLKRKKNSQHKSVNLALVLGVCPKHAADLYQDLYYSVTPPNKLFLLQGRTAGDKSDRCSADFHDQAATS